MILSKEDDILKGYRLALTFAQIDKTPFGPLSFVAGDNGLRGVAFQSLKELKHGLVDSGDAPSLKGFKTLSSLLVEINDYLVGIQKTFSVDIDWRVSGCFQQQVLMLTTEIPYGQVSTYGEIAERLGKPGAARAVGAALGRNPMPIVIPCHRVIGSDDALHGYIGGEDIKAYLLSLEGRTIKNQKVIDR